jgi:hypothetical protein
MKRPLITLSLLLPVSVFAQNYPGMGGAGMNQADMQEMMKNAQEMQVCMQGVDQSKLQQLEQQARQVETEVKALCNSGERDTAQNEAVSFAREMLDNPDIQKVMKCGEQMRGMMPQMPFMDQASNTDPSSSHVCDQ